MALRIDSRSRPKSRTRTMPRRVSLKSVGGECTSALFVLPDEPDRSHSGTVSDDIASTLIPLPSLVAPLAIPRVTVRIPSYVTQHALTPLRYTVHNPSLTRSLRASVQVEGGEPWAFAGPRRTAPLLILPSQLHHFDYTVVATSGAGETALPVVRILEHLPATSPAESDIMSPRGASIDGSVTEEMSSVASAQGAARTRELPILVEGAPAGRPLTVFVVPAGEGW